MFYGLYIILLLYVLLFFASEIKSNLFQMNPFKAPGLDCFHAKVYQTFWNILGDNVINFCLDMLNKGMPIGRMNSSLNSEVSKPSNI